MDIKMNVRKAMQRQGITAADFAARLQVSKVTAARYLKDNITLATLEKIAAALNTTPAALLADPAQEDHTNPARIACPHCGKPLTIHLTPDE